MSTECERIVMESIASVFANKGVNHPPLSPASRLDGSLGLDSLDFAELVVRLEAEFGRDPFAAEVNSPCATVAQLAQLYEPVAITNH